MAGTTKTDPTGKMGILQTAAETIGSTLGKLIAKTGLNKAKTAPPPTDTKPVRKKRPTRPSKPRAAKSTKRAKARISKKKRPPK